jgi:Zn-dependent protease with chaperone function
MYFLLGISVLLAAMLILNAAGSLTTALAWMGFRKKIRSWSPVTSARTLFLMLTIPTAVAVICVLFLLAPAFVLYEPKSGHEGVSVKLAILAVLGAAGLLLSLAKALASWHATTCLVREWLKHAEPTRLQGVSASAFRFEHHFPLIAVIGIFRPRLFIANKVFESLTPEELAAALQHEAGHISARDNLKRAVMRSCRDILILNPFARKLEQAWLEATESAADDHATRVGGNTSVDLASALVKIARMVPAGVRPTVPASAFLFSGVNSHGFSSRVGRLLQPDPHPSSGSFKVSLRFFSWLLSIVFILGIALLVTQPQLFLTAHYAIEHLVHFLG